MLAMLSTSSDPAPMVTVPAKALLPRILVVPPVPKRVKLLPEIGPVRMTASEPLPVLRMSPPAGPSTKVRSVDPPSTAVPFVPKFSVPASPTVPR